MKGMARSGAVENPPYRSVSNIDGSYRPRRYKDIPYVKTLGIFAEDNFKWDIGRRSLDIQLGARYDHTSVVGGTLSPRFNASFDIIPEILSVRGG
jgi:outer membrane receptor for ferrienterochelin and colicin